MARNQGKQEKSQFWNLTWRFTLETSEYIAQRTEGRDCRSESEMCRKWRCSFEIAQKCTKIGPRRLLQPQIRALPWTHPGTNLFCPSYHLKMQKRWEVFPLSSEIVWIGTIVQFRVDLCRIVSKCKGFLNVICSFSPIIF